jgi:hypothetical protein
MIHQATVDSPTTYHITLISGTHLVWLTHEKPVADQNGVLVFIDSCGNEITVPQSAVWIEGQGSKKQSAPARS